MHCIPRGPINSLQKRKNGCKKKDDALTSGGETQEKLHSLRVMDAIKGLDAVV